MMRQLPLFAQDPPLSPASRRTDPDTSRAAEASMNKSRRRQTQLDAILARLRRGPATNAQLAALSLKYTGRISDLRALGHDIRCERQGDDGTTTYMLTEPGQGGRTR